MIREKDLPEGWKKVELKGIFEIRKGKKVNITENLKSDSIPYIFIGNLRDVPISQYSNDKKGLLCEDDDILLVWDGANCGTVGTGLTGYVGSTIARLRLIDNSLNKDYIFKFLKLKFKYFNSNTSGATIPHLDKKKVHSLKIPLPPKETQKKIVSILEKAEQLKEHRKEADKLIDEYLKSKFLEMFGDPIKNDKKFEYDLLTNLCEFKSGGTPTRKNKEYFKGDIPWVRSVALGGKYIDSKNAIEFITLGAIKNSATKIIPKNSIMIGVRVGVGKTSINKCDMCTSQDIMSLVNIDKRLQNEFLLNVFEKYIKHFESQMRGATIKGITTAILKNLKIAIPPIELQNKFANIVEKVEKMKEYQKNSKQQIDDLYNNLMQKAFRGELVC